MPKQRIYHIARITLPWRPSPPISECGKREGTIIELNEVLAQPLTWIDDPGSGWVTRSYIPGNADERACKTCWETMRRWSASRTSLAQQLLRELEAHGASYMQPTMEHTRIERELHALAALADLHRDEFDLLLAGADPDVVPSLDREYERKRVELERLLGAAGEGADLRTEGLDEAGAD